MYINNDINYLKYLKSKKVYIFGAGYRGKNSVYKLRKENIYVQGFIDNDKRLQTKKIDGLPVISLSGFLSLNNKEVT